MKPLTLRVLPIKETHVRCADVYRTANFLHPKLLLVDAEKDQFIAQGIEFEMGGWGLRVAVKINKQTNRGFWYIAVLDEHEWPRNLSLKGRGAPIPADGTWVPVPLDSPDNKMFSVSVEETFMWTVSTYDLSFFSDDLAPPYGAGGMEFVTTDPLPVTEQGD